MFLKTLIEKFATAWKRLFGSKATEQETQDYIARLERAVDELTLELVHQKYIAEEEKLFAKWKAEEEEHERENREYREEREREEQERAEQDQREQDWEDEQRQYQSECPFCGSPKRLGKCPECDHAFGHD